MPEAKASPRNHGPVAPTKRKFEDEEATEPASMKPEPEQPKRTKIIGPTLPPRVEAADSHQPKNNSDGSDSDSESESDDDYGPSLPDPSSATTTTTTSTTAELERQRAFQEAENTPAPTVTKRDDWMLRPPEQLDLSSRVDPTKLRNRKFNTGSAARRNDPAAGGGSVSTWTETADEKRKRLENEVMGVQAPSNSAGGLKVSPAESSAMKKQVQEYNEKNRNQSLYSRHQSDTSKEEADDPSSRAFDKEKDIRAPSKINHAQRRQMLNKAADFGSRFSGGNFL